MRRYRYSLFAIFLCIFSACTKDGLSEFSLDMDVAIGDYKIKFYNASLASPKGALMFSSFNPKLTSDNSIGVLYIAKLFDAQKTLVAMIRSCKKSAWTSINIPFTDHPLIDQIKYYSVEISTCNGAEAD